MKIKLLRWLGPIGLLCAQGCTTTSTFTLEGKAIERLAPSSQQQARAEKSASNIDWIDKQYADAASPALAHYLEKDVLFLHNPEVEAYLTGIANTLVANWPGPRPEFRILVESSDSYDAVADASGVIRIRTGMLRNVDNEAELAGWIAHEMAHVLLDHSVKQGSIAELPYYLESAATFGLVWHAHNKDRSLEQHLRDDKTRKDLLKLHAFSTIWSDVLSPGWSRDQERDADQLAIDLLIAAGYSPRPFVASVSTVQTARIAGNSSLDLYRGLLKTYYADTLRSECGNTDGSFLCRMASVFGMSLVDSVFNGLVRNTSEYDNPELRLELVKQYMDLNYERTELPYQIPDTGFTTLLRQRAAYDLDADLRALNMIDAVKDAEWDDARSWNARIGYTNAAAPVTALAITHPRFTRRYDSQHMSQLDRAIRSPYAPASAYTRLAQAHLWRNQPDRAVSILELAERNIGRKYRFLPLKVQALRALDRTQDAEDLAISCADHDRPEPFRIPVGRKTEEKRPLYQLCSDALGYDPIAKRKRDKERARAERRNNPMTLSDIWESITKPKDK